MICNKIKWHTIHIGMELFAGPYECQRLFLCLRISSLGVCQTTTCIADDSRCILVLLGQYRSQSNWAGIGNYLGWGIFVEVPQSLSTGQSLVKLLKGLLLFTFKHERGS